MGASQSLPELVVAAQTNAKTLEDRISEMLKLADGQGGPKAQIAELYEATVALELAAVDIYSVFEARMQHHFRRGPFSRKLKSLLLEAGEKGLADRIHQYYLAINVLKHGKGASHRELLSTPNSIIAVKPNEEATVDEDRPSEGLVDVGVPGFFEGLTTAILDAYHFLENKKAS